MNRRLLVFSTLALVIIGVIFAFSRTRMVTKAATETTEKSTLKVGQAAVPFQVSSTEGFFDSAAIHAPILLEVFATWCPHCQREVSILNHIQHDYGTKLKIISVNGSNIGSDQVSPETQADVVAFAEHFAVTYPIAFDPTLTVAKNYLLSGFPTMVLIDRNGRIASFASGEESEEALRKRIKRVI